jgi:putative FmdB family regulatory protein
MPLYEYKCPNGHLTEVIHGMNDPSPEQCEVCGEGPLVGVLHAVAVDYKGSGFYTTDYGGKSKPARDSGGSGDSSGGSGGSGDSSSSSSGSGESSSSSSGDGKKAAEA